MLTAIRLAALLLGSTLVPGPALAQEAGTADDQAITEPAIIEEVPGVGRAGRENPPIYSANPDQGVGTGASGAAHGDAINLPPRTARTVVGTYRLVSVGGEDLPYRSGDFLTCEEHVLSGAVELFDDRTYMMKTLTRQTCDPLPEGDSVVEYPELQYGRWSARGDAVVLAPEAIGASPADVSARSYWTGLPFEELGNRAEVEGKRLVATLKDKDEAAVFEATDGQPGAG